MYKKDLAFYNMKWLISHKRKQTKPQKFRLNSWCNG